MRNKKRINLIIEAISDYWLEHPDYRFHQALQGMGIESTEDNFYVSDTDILKVLKIKVKEFEEN
jgi:uncharacterized protein YihD (DUF1040 family)